MKICVVKDESGAISVGVEPPEMEEAPEAMGGSDYLQPVEDEREALMRVRELLAGDTAEDPQAAADFEEGYAGNDISMMTSRGMQ